MIYGEERYDDDQMDERLSKLLDLEDPAEEYGLSQDELGKVDQIAQNLWAKYRGVLGEQINPRECCERHRETDISLAATINTFQGTMPENESEETSLEDLKYVLPDNFQEAVYKALEKNRIGEEDVRQDLARDMSTMNIGGRIKEMLEEENENADFGIH